MNMIKINYYLAGDIWNGKVPLWNGKEVSISSGVRTHNTKNRSFKNEHPKIRREVERVIYEKVMERNLRAKTGDDSRTWTITDACRFYLNNRTPMKKDSRNDIGRIRKITEHFGDRDMRTLKVGDVDHFLLTLEKRTLKSDASDFFNNGSHERRSRTTVKRYFELLRAMFNYLEIKFPGTTLDFPQTRRDRIFSDDEVRRLLSAAKEVREEFYRFMIIAFSAANRQGEIIDMFWKNVDFEGCFFRNDTSKNGEAIQTGLNDIAKQTLLTQLAAVPNTPEGRVWSWKCFPRKLWSRTVEISGVKECRFHDIRHHVVTQVANRDGIHIAKEVAHHKCITTTQIYVNPTREMVQRAYDNISIPVDILQTCDSMNVPQDTRKFV